MAQRRTRLTLSPHNGRGPRAFSPVCVQQRSAGSTGDDGNSHAWHAPSYVESVTVQDRPGHPVAEVSRKLTRPGRGDVLLGKYRVDHVLGHGSMGVIVAARHVGLGTEVAIKWLNDWMAADAEAVARFEQEARAAARIRGDHVVRVLDIGTLEDGSPAMVMERLDGEDLARRLERSGSLPVEEAADYVLQACDGVGEAHALGIVHRDLKPENLFCAIRSNGACCVKVLDFGISKIASLSLTRTNSIMGSPYYMSPEQMSSPRDVDARADIWALGVVLHELITGSVPFGGNSFPEVCLRVIQSPPASMLDARPEAPFGLQAIILRCLEKDRSRRFAEVAELANALAPFAGRPAPSPRRAPVGGRSASKARRWLRGRRRMLVGALGSLAALVVIGGVVVHPGRSAAFVARGDRTSPPLLDVVVPQEPPEAPAELSIPPISLDDGNGAACLPTWHSLPRSRGPSNAAASPPPSPARPKAGSLYDYRK